MNTAPENWMKKTHAQKRNTCWTKIWKKRVRLTKSEKKFIDTEKSVWRREKKEYKNISYTSTWSAILCECSWHHSETHTAASTTPNKWGKKTTIHRNHFVVRQWIQFGWFFLTWFLHFKTGRIVFFNSKWMNGKFERKIKRDEQMYVHWLQ